MMILILSFYIKNQIIFLHFMNITLIAFIIDIRL